MYPSVQPEYFTNPILKQIKWRQLLLCIQNYPENRVQSLNYKSKNHQDSIHTNLPKNQKFKDYKMFTKKKNEKRHKVERERTQKLLKIERLDESPIRVST